MLRMISHAYATGQNFVRVTSATFAAHKCSQGLNSNKPHTVTDLCLAALKLY